MSEEAKSKLIDRFFVNHRLYFNIISHELESFYLENAWIGKYKSKKPILIINIGGKTTELILAEDNTVTERVNIDLGVGTILKNYKGINENYSLVDINTIVDDIFHRLPSLDIQCENALYTGGELNYMKITNYDLVENIIFEDVDHPYSISFSDFTKKNNQVFSEISIDDLRKLMPQNPSWMNGVRACSALAQAICLKYGIKIIIPSNSNLLDGVIRKEFFKVTLCGSFRRSLDKIARLKEKLNENGISVLSPINTEIASMKNGFVLFSGEIIEKGQSTWSIERKHLNAIDNSDCVIICNYDGYIGLSTNIEIGYSIGKNKKIIFLEHHESLMDFDFPLEIGIL
jgi:hypothetical protein